MLSIDAVSPSGSSARRRGHRAAGALGAALALVMLLGLSGPASAGAGVAAAAARHVRTLIDPRITESSGLARSAYSRTRLWTHNDSGGGTTIYAIGPTGKTTATFALTGASHLDWEGMASAVRHGVGYLFLGDIGDNAAKRSSIYVHRVREPRPRRHGGSLRPISYQFRYPDGAHNAETLMVRPGSLRIYVVTKGKGGPGAIYVAPRHLSTSHVNRLRRIGPAPEGMADGVFLDRHRFILRGYVNGWLYRRIGATPVLFPLPVKGESIAKSWRRGYVFVGSEGRNSPIWQVRIP